MKAKTKKKASRQIIQKRKLESAALTSFDLGLSWRVGLLGILFAAGASSFWLFCDSIITSKVSFMSWRIWNETNVTEYSDIPSLELTLLERYDLVHKAAIRTSSKNGVRGLVLTEPVLQGDMLLMIPEYNTITVSTLEKEHPNIRALLKSIFSMNQINKRYHPTIEELLIVTAGLLEHLKGPVSYFHPYLKSLPHNVSQMGLYWTEQERNCVLYQDNSFYSIETLPTFRHVFASLREGFAPLARVNDTTAEWMYVMAKTRAFGNSLVPVLDLANHNSAVSVSPFVTLSKQSGVKMHYLVATQSWNTSEPLWNSYRHMSVTNMAEWYGFVDYETATFVSSPTLIADMKQHAQYSNDKRFHQLCFDANLDFFGELVPTGYVQAQWGQLRQKTFMMPGQPTELTYHCLRVLLNAPANDSVMAQYVYTKLEHDQERHRQLASHPVCQADTGAFPLIRQSNKIAADLLEHAMAVAQAAIDNKSKYPSIEYL